MEKEVHKEYAVVLTVFSFLEPKDVCCTAALVCKYWASLSKEQLLWQNFVKRDHPNYLLPEGEDWITAWRNLQVRTINRNNTHPKVTISADGNQVSNEAPTAGNGDEWFLAMINGEMHPTDNKLHYCEWRIDELGSGNIMFGVADHVVDAKTIQFDGWGFQDGWMTMAHSINLCCGIPNYQTEGWSCTYNAHVEKGDRVGVLIDTRLDKGTPGADIYFAVNGVCRPVAFKGITNTLCFAIAFCYDSQHLLTIVPHPQKPAIPPAYEP